MKRKFDTKWSYNKYEDWWELPPIGMSFNIFTATRNDKGKWSLIMGCSKAKRLGVFKYLRDAKRAAILYQELNDLIELDKP